MGNFPPLAICIAESQDEWCSEQLRLRSITKQSQEIHLIAINKSFDKEVNGQFNIKYSGKILEDAFGVSAEVRQRFRRLPRSAIFRTIHFHIPYRQLRFAIWCCGLLTQWGWSLLLNWIVTLIWRYFPIRLMINAGLNITFRKSRNQIYLFFQRRDNSSNPLSTCRQPILWFGMPPTSEAGKLLPVFIMWWWKAKEGRFKPEKSFLWNDLPALSGESLGISRAEFHLFVQLIWNIFQHLDNFIPVDRFGQIIIPFRLR